MTKLVCPRHEGAYDCTPFCDVCEGNQEYTYTETRPCRFCDIAVDHDTWFEEMGLCLECSTLYWSHDEENCSWGCMATLPATIGAMVKEKRKGGV
jgi:hypothetical protein